MENKHENDNSIAMSLIQKGIDLLKKENEILKQQNLLMERQLKERQFMSKSAAAKFLGVSHTQVARLVQAGKLKCHNGRISRLDLYRYSDANVAAVKHQY